MVRLSIPARLCFRDLALSAVLAAIDADGTSPNASARDRMPDATRDEVISALNEAFNNIVLHAYRGVQGGTVELHVEARPGEVEIRLHDRGRGFDPESVSGYAPSELDEGAPSISSLPESGMGLFIIRSFMDDVTYTRGGGGKPNVLVLRKRWSSEAVTSRKETSQSGWRMRSVAVPSSGQRTAGSLKRK